MASALIHEHLGKLAGVAKAPFKRAVFLGSGSRFGAAREAALKMLEMTAGRVTTMCETYLGLRHGPMSYVHGDTLVVCFLSSDPTLRAYEADLVRELDQKELGLLKVLVGEGVPGDLVRENDVALECPGLEQLGDENFAAIDVIAGQLLAFFRCREEGLRPDSPSEDGVISRVVQTFALHLPQRLRGDPGLWGRLASRSGNGPISVSQKWNACVCFFIFFHLLFFLCFCCWAVVKSSTLETHRNGGALMKFATCFALIPDPAGSSRRRPVRVRARNGPGHHHAARSRTRLARWSPTRKL